MKKQVLLLTSLIISTFAIAQVRPNFGIRAGVTSSSMSGDAVNNLQNIIDFTNGRISTNSRQGFFAGGYVSFPVSSSISIEPALYYSQKGYELKGALDFKGFGLLGANAKTKLNSQYLDVPVVVKVNLGSFQVFAGPQVSYLMNANLQTTAGVLGFNLLNKSMEVTERFNKADFAITGGVGLKITPVFNIIASYDYGLSKADANRNVSTYNRSFKVGIGMSL